MLLRSPGPRVSKGRLWPLGKLNQYFDSSVFVVLALNLLPISRQFWAKMIRVLALAAGASALMAPAPARPAATQLSAEVSSVECVFTASMD